MNIVVKYDGEYPNLCSGNLIVIINGKEWKFPDYCLSSGGSVTGGPPDWDFEIETGPWSIMDWPERFPDDEYLKLNVIEAVNSSISWGCCGGCI